jgi:hypothetical protein
MKAAEYQPLDRSVARKMFRALETAAGIKHVPRRGFHGFRRLAVDQLLDQGAEPEVIKAGGNWSTIQVPMDLYRDQENRQARRQAAELLQRAKTTTGPTDQPSLPAINAVYTATYTDLAQALKGAHLTDVQVDEVLKVMQWAWVELNYRPHAYQACALTT